MALISREEIRNRSLEGKQADDKKQPEEDPELAWWREEAERTNQGCILAKKMGITVKTSNATAELNPDGSIKQADNDEQEDAEPQEEKPMPQDDLPRKSVQKSVPSIGDKVEVTTLKPWDGTVVGLEVDRGAQGTQFAQVKNDATGEVRVVAYGNLLKLKRLQSVRKVLKSRLPVTKGEMDDLRALESIKIIKLPSGRYIASEDGKNPTSILPTMRGGTDSKSRMQEIVDDEIRELKRRKR